MVDRPSAIGNVMSSTYKRLLEAMIADCDNVVELWT